MGAMWQGSVLSIHIAREASTPTESLAEVRAVPGRGLEGDRYFHGRGTYSPRASVGGREVTLIESECVEALFGGIVNADGATLGIKLAPGDARRNVVTLGVPLNPLVEVLMRGTRLCEPCKHLEDLTQQGVRGGLVHRGGLRARILNEGTIHAGDVIRPRT
jgi:hypothetical protein